MYDNSLYIALQKQTTTTVDRQGWKIHRHAEFYLQNSIGGGCSFRWYVLTLILLIYYFETTCACGSQSSFLTRTRAGDVIYHSIVDAIFGALTLPDIGQVFQDTDPRWKGCDSSKFMEHAFKVMKYYGYKIGNLDVTLILERPKVASVKFRMKENIVRLLGTTDGRVNIKARTHEKVDSVGELRSLSCHVVVTLEKE